jgi:Histidine kinase-, DNA gyrase B-, and HSP90-like ATPase
MFNAEAAERLSANSTETDYRLKDMLERITQADRQAIDIIQHLKKLLQRRSEVESQEFDLNDVIADAMYVLSPEAKDRSVALRVHGAEQPLLVRADRVHLQQVIVTLTMNALDAMIDTALDVRRITIQAAMRAKAIVQVSVSDTGTGIPEDKLSEIFEAFYTTKEQGQGSDCRSRAPSSKPTAETFGRRTGPGAERYFALRCHWFVDTTAYGNGWSQFLCTHLAASAQDRGRDGDCSPPPGSTDARLTWAARTVKPEQGSLQTLQCGVARLPIACLCPRP